MTGPTRRQVLQQAGATAGTFAVAALAGCSNDTAGDGGDGSSSDGGDSDSDSGSGDDSSDSGGSENGGADPAYGSWLLPPREVESDRYVFRSSQPRRLLSLESSLGDVDLGQFSGTVAPGIQWSDVASFHRVPGAVVLTGDFTVEEWQSSLTEQEFSESETYRGFTLYTSDGGGAIGFGDGTVVVNQSSRSGLATVRTVIDANNGEVATGPEADDTIGALVGALGDGEVVAGGRTEGQTPFENSVAAGQRFTLGEQNSEYRAAVVFGTEGDVETERLRELVGSSELFDGPGDVSVEQRGRVAVVTGALATGDVSTLSPSLEDGSERDGTPAPAVQFEFESNGQGTLTITHTAGDIVPATELYIRGSGFANTSGVDMTGPGQWQGSTDDEGDVAAGNAVTIGVSDDWEISVVWQSPDGSRSATLAEQSA